MGRHILVLGIAFAALAAFAVAAGWFFFSASEPTPNGWSLGPLWPYLVGAAVLALALGGFLTWLAFYSARHDLDERD
ncbi:hypothetical protein [Phenylobacterium sp.]|jgi:hypothetical protein|uniref:hypothetical protein n=1 Tax=Phenylobacterium sp. TaxID=1871053 RepID=UPI002F9410D2